MLKIPGSDISVNILGEIGKGTFGTVYKVEIQKDIANRFPTFGLFPGKLFALKVVDYEGIEQEEIYKEEMDVIEKLFNSNNCLDLLCYYYVHQNVADQENNKGQFFFLSELMDGDVYKFVKVIAIYDVEYKISQINNMYLSCYLGLKQLHNMNIVHRDIKTENILFKGNKNIGFQFKLGDFGLSCSLEPNKSYSCKNFLSTWAYADPLKTIFKITGQSDIPNKPVSDFYSLGIVLLYCCDKFFDPIDEDKDDGFIDYLVEIQTEIDALFNTEIEKRKTKKLKEKYLEFEKVIENYLKVLQKEYQELSAIILFIQIYVLSRLKMVRS